MLKSIEENIDSVKIENQEGLTKPANFLFELLTKCGVTFDKKNYLFEIMQRLLQYFGAQTPNPRHHNGASLAKFNDFLQVIVFFEALISSIHKITWNNRIYLIVSTQDCILRHYWSIEWPR